MHYWEDRMPENQSSDDIHRLSELISSRRKIVFFTGAGASTESGIPDFRSFGGIWTRFDPDDFTLDRFLNSHASRKKQWEFFLGAREIRFARPNHTHLTIAALEKEGWPCFVITQNIDGLHQKAGSDPGRVFELHGNIAYVTCVKCHNHYSTEWVIERNSGLCDVPECEYCGGILKPDVVFFGENLPQDVLDAAIYHACHCDLFIVLGSSLVVYPAAHIPMYAKEKGAKLVIVNGEETSYDGFADLVIRGKTGEIMKGVLEEIHSSGRG
jgi:NAD-dependent deacetylase